MSDTITRCIEEEYSFCLSCLWRWRAGWRPLLIYFRGPGDVSFLSGLILTLLGIWRFARRPRRLADADPATFYDARVKSVYSGLGSYGMGGPGFAGLQLVTRNHRSFWIVFTVWGAVGWLTIGDDPVSDARTPATQRELADERRFRLLSDLVGSTLTGVRLESAFAELTLSGTSESFVVTLRRDSSSLPVHAGSKLPKMLSASEDVRDAVVISRKASLWV